MTEILFTILSGFNQIAVVFLLQSTIVLLLGLMIAKLAQRRGSMIQAEIFRATFVGVCASPILALALSWLGVNGLALKLPMNSEVEASVPTGLRSNDTLHLTIQHTTSTSTDSAPIVSRELFVSPDDVSDEVYAEFAPEQDSVDGLNASPSYDNGTMRYALPELASKNESSPTGSRNPSWNGLVLWILPGFWLAGSIWLLARLLVELKRVRRLCHSAVNASESINQLVGRLAESLNMNAPRVAVHDLIASPCVTGFWSPLVLLPNALQDPTSLEKSLIHELAHLRRGDVKWNFVQRIGLVWLFPQPLLWWLVYRMESVAEDVCDDFVVKFTQDRAGYAQQLIELAESQQALPNIAGLGMFSSHRSVLYGRVDRILDASRQLSIRLNGWSVMLVVGILLLLSFAGSSFRHQNSSQPGEIFEKPDVASARGNADDAQITFDDAQALTSAFQDSALQDVESPQIPEQIEVRGVVRGAVGQPAHDVDIVVDYWMEGINVTVNTKSNAKGEYSVLIPKDSRYLQIRAFADGRLSQGIEVQRQTVLRDISMCRSIWLPLGSLTCGSETLTGGQSRGLPYWPTAVTIFRGDFDWTPPFLTWTEMLP